MILQQSEAPYGSSHWGNDATPEAGFEAYMNELVTRIQQGMLKTKLQNPKTVDIFAAAFKSNTRIPQTQDPGETEALYSTLCPQIRWYLQNEHPTYLSTQIVVTYNVSVLS